MRAVRFDRYGGVEVLQVVDVPWPPAAAGRAAVQVMATAINPGEASIRKGLLHERWPATFPSGEGSDLAGMVTEVGAGVTSVRPGDEVLGWTGERARVHRARKAAHSRQDRADTHRPGRHGRLSRPGAGQRERSSTILPRTERLRSRSNASLTSVSGGELSMGTDSSPRASAPSAARIAPASVSSDSISPP